MANNSRILRIKNAKFSGYCFYMNTNIWGDFQICVSVTLKASFDRTAPGDCFLSLSVNFEKFLRTPLL